MYVCIAWYHMLAVYVYEEEEARAGRITWEEARAGRITSILHGRRLGLGESLQYLLGTCYA